MIPNGPLHPHLIPLPGVSKSLLPGGNNNLKKYIVDDFQFFYKLIEKVPVGGAFKHNYKLLDDVLSF